MDNDIFVVYHIVVYQTYLPVQARQYGLHKPFGLCNASALQSQKGMVLNSNRPRREVNAVFSLSASSTSTCQYSAFRSRQEKHCAPASCSNESSVLSKSVSFHPVWRQWQYRWPMNSTKAESCLFLAYYLSAYRFHY